MAEVVTAGGVRIPKIGCGTYPMRGALCAEIVAEALRVGFRHIDTAQGYDNEAAVGEGILHSARPAPRDLRHHQGAAAAHRRRSAAALGRGEPEAAQGRCRRPAPHPLAQSGSIGRRKHAGAERRQARRPDPRDRRLEFRHRQARRGDRGQSRTDRSGAVRVPPLPRPDPASRGGSPARSSRSRLIARSRSARSRAIPASLRSARSTARAPSRWRSAGSIQQDDVIAIPKTSRPERLKENLAVFDFRLTDEEMDQISRMTVPNSRLINEPRWVPHWD